jgi:hypothetical protein
MNAGIRIKPRAYKSAMTAAIVRNVRSFIRFSLLKRIRYTFNNPNTQGVVRAA